MKPQDSGPIKAASSFTLRRAVRDGASRPLRCVSAHDAASSARGLFRIGKAALGVCINHVLSPASTIFTSSAVK